MKFKFEFLFRTYIFICVGVLGWSFWAMAQSPSSIFILEPKEDSKFTSGTNLTITTKVERPSEEIRHVEFMRGEKSLGLVSNAPYDLVWTNVPTGTHHLRAKLVDAAGVTNISAKVEIQVHRFETYLTFGLDRITALQWDGIFGFPLWQYLASLIYIFFAFYFSKLLDFLTRVWLKRWSAKTKTTLDDLLLDLLNGPVKVVSFVVLLHVGLNIFPWTEWVEGFLSKALRLIVAISVTYTLLKAVDLLLGYWKAKSKTSDDKSFDEQLFPIVSKTLKAFVIIVAVLVTWQSLSDQPITAILASLSIGGLAIGLAAQDTIANFFGAVVVFVDKPFRVGDHIQLPEVDGKVELIGLRSTRVRNLNGHLITVPNKTMGNATITNLTKRPNIKTTMNIGVTYDTSTVKLKRALEILRNVYQNHPQTSDLIISFNQFADSALNIMVIHWWNGTDGKEHLAVMQELNLQVKEQFDAEGIGFAFPSRTIYLKQDSEWRLSNHKDEPPKLLDQKV